MKDLHDNLDVVLALDPQDTGSDTDGNTIDLQGYESVEFVCESNELASGETASFNVQESSDNSNWSNVDSGDMLGSEPSFDDSSGANIGQVGYIGNERYVRVQLVSPSTSRVFSAEAIKNNARHKPVN